jgi:hypothetical protein
MTDGIITFDEASREFIIRTLGKDIDPSGFIVERDCYNTKVMTPEGECIKAHELACIKKDPSSDKIIFIKNDIVSLIKLSDEVV